MSNNQRHRIPPMLSLPNNNYKLQQHLRSQPYLLHLLSTIIINQPMNKKDIEKINYHHKYISIILQYFQNFNSMSVLNNEPNSNVLRSNKAIIFNISSFVIKFSIYYLNILFLSFLYIVQLLKLPTNINSPMRPNIIINL